jgi:hypothetical protein
MKIISLLVLLMGCNFSEKSPVTLTSYLIEPGDIIVTNSGNTTVVLLDSAGNYKDTLLDLAQAEVPMGIGFNSTTKEVLIAVNSTADRVIGISAYNGTRSDFINDIANLTGNLYGITQISQGDVLIVESNNIERYSSSGDRVTSGAWPKALQTTGSDIKGMSDGNFIHCSSGTDRAIVYTSAGITSLDSGASGIAGTTDLFGCIPLANGGFALAWNGTTDTIQIRASNLTTVNATFSNTTVLGNPRGIAQRENGNILIVDQSANHIVEITESGTLVNTFGQAISSPVQIFIVPDFY